MPAMGSVDNSRMVAICHLTSNSSSSRWLLSVPPKMTDEDLTNLQLEV